MSQPICDVCVGALEHRYNPISADTCEGRLIEGKEAVHVYNDFGHHRSWASLRASIDSDCWICSRITKPLPFVVSAARLWMHSRTGHGEIHTQNLRLHDYVTTVTITVPDLDGCAEVRVHYVQGDDCDEQALKLSFTMLQVSGELDTDVSILQLDDTESTGSSRSLSTVREWIRNCVDNHERCNLFASKSVWYPTRLIDLGEPGRSSELLRLVITDRMPMQGPYATLSHCWGRNQFLKLMKATLHRLCIGFQIGDLPKTFQEAIVVCRALQIRYIWVDSLCIMQDKDDLNDWIMESSLMHKVYTRSHLNISAADAQDGTEGLFRNRMVTARKQTRIRATLQTVDQALDTKEYALEESVYWHVNVSESHIQKRGWVFQERIMAPRVVHFTKTQLVWECQESSACEKYPEKIPSTFLEGSNYKQRLSYEHLVEMTAVEEWNTRDIDECYRKWSALVLHYSQTVLTRPSDKMTAISGLAKSVAKVTGGSYVAGMWRGILEHQLLWTARNRWWEETRRVREFCAPTWSWASMQATIVMNEERFHPSQVKFSIERVDITHVTDDPFGQISTASIDLQGELRTMSVRQEINSEEAVWYMTLHPDHGEHVFEYWRADEHNDRGDPYVGYDVNARLFYMNFIITHTQFMSMLLRLVDDRTGTFERWGLIQVDRKYPVSGDERMRAAILADLDESIKEEVPCLRYEGGKHTIRLI